MSDNPCNWCGAAIGEPCEPTCETLQSAADAAAPDNPFNLNATGAVDADRYKTVEVIRGWRARRKAVP